MAIKRTVYAVAIMAALLASAAGAIAADVNWILDTPSGAYSWFDVSKWDTGVVPIDGQSVETSGNNNTYSIDIENGGAGVDLSNSVITLGRDIFNDSDAGTVDTFIGNDIFFRGEGGRHVIMNVPTIVNGLAQLDKYGVEFNAPVTAGVIKAKNNQSQVRVLFNAAPAGPLTHIDFSGVSSTSAYTTINAPVSVATYDQGNSRLEVTAGGSLDISSAWNYTGGDITVNGPINLSGAAVFPAAMASSHVYTAGFDGALSTSPMSIPAGSVMNIAAAQSPANWMPANKITVGLQGVLSGDMTGAIFDPTNPGQNVSIAPGAVYAPSVAPSAPLTKADVGGTVWLGVSDTNHTNGADSYVAGDDGSGVVDHGFAFGTFTNTYHNASSNATFTSRPGSGEMLMLVAGSTIEPGGDLNGCIEWQDNWTMIGDGTSTTADIALMNNKNIRWRYPNKTATTDDVAGRILTFNVHGFPGSEGVGVLSLTSAGEVQADQIINVTYGMVNIDKDFQNTMKGKLSIGNGGGVYLNLDGDRRFIMDNPDTVFELKSGSALRVGYNYEQWEDLDPSQVIVEENPDLAPIAIFLDGTHTIDSDTIMADVMDQCDIGITHNGGDTIFDGTHGIRLGDGRYVISGRRLNKTPNVKIAAGTTYFGKADGATTIGIASIPEAVITVQVPTEAAGATLKVGKAGELRSLMSQGNFQRHWSTGTGRVRFEAEIAADAIDIEAGTMQTTVDQTVANLNIAIDAKLDLDGGNEPTMMVTGTLSGLGSWEDGNGILVATGATVAPGASVGVLTGSSQMVLEDGAIYALEIADTAGVAGVSSDLVLGQTFDFDATDDFDGALTVKINAAGESDVAIAATDAFVLFATAGGGFEIPEVWTITYDAAGLDTTEATLTLVEDYADVDNDDNMDDCLVLTGMIGVAEAPSGDLMGDANGDRLVDDNDLSLLLANWGKDADWAHGEFSGVAPVDDNDLSLLLANWTGSGSAGLVVPEPASLALLGLGALAVLRLRRK